MRLAKLKNLFSLTKYRQLQRDFRNPLTALFAASGIRKKSYTLFDKTHQRYCSDRTDEPLWQAYFSQASCKVVPENGLFKIMPHNPKHPAYLIEGCHHCFTYQPQRWSREIYKSPLAKQLEQAEKQVFSQHGEDGILEYLFSKIPVINPLVIEFGAYDGEYMSNSRNLIVHHNWRALLIEADERFYKTLQSRYQDHPRVTTLKSLVTPSNINTLFSNHAVPKDFDVLSIDIDSIDYYVWQALTAFTPKVVIIEYNPSIAPDVEYVVDVDKASIYGGTAREGASLLALYKLGKQKGYEFIANSMEPTCFSYTAIICSISIISR